VHRDRSRIDHHHRPAIERRWSLREPSKHSAPRLDYGRNSPWSSAGLSGGELLE
jgi:hypothetical protein